MENVSNILKVNYLIRMMKCLGEIVDVQSWYYLHAWSFWDVVYLQGKDFDEFGDLKKWSLTPELDSKEVQERQYLQDWDILFASKWVRNFASVYKKEYGNCVASSTFFVLRIRGKDAVKILPEYLAILLTQASKWKYFQDNISWWYIQAISKPTLLNYELEIPSIDKQEKIIKYYELYKRQIRLYDELKEKKETLANQLILQSNTLNND